MVATDLAARGLDIRQLPYVVNYDFPSNLETYIHRVGRTGRLAAYGHAYSFFTRNLVRVLPATAARAQVPCLPLLPCARCSATPAGRPPHPPSGVPLTASANAGLNHHRWSAPPPSPLVCPSPNRPTSRGR